MKKTETGSEYTNIVVPENLKFDEIEIYYPDGKLITKSDSPLVIDFIRTQIYNYSIKGCYAISGGIKCEIDGGNWPFNGIHTEILAGLILAKEKFRKNNE